MNQAQWPVVILPTGSGVLPAPIARDPEIEIVLTPRRRTKYRTFRKSERVDGWEWRVEVITWDLEGKRHFEDAWHILYSADDHTPTGGWEEHQANAIQNAEAVCSAIRAIWANKDSRRTQRIKC